MITIFSVGTGGVYNNRAMLDGESAKEYSRHNFVQWHRIAVYQDKLANLVRSLKPG
jgi:single-strand DNA-binding protein